MAGRCTCFKTKQSRWYKVSCAMMTMICNMLVMIIPMMRWYDICKILMILRMPTKMISGLCGRLETGVLCVLWMFFQLLLCLQDGGARGGLFWSWWFSINWLVYWTGPFNKSRLDRPEQPCLRIIVAGVTWRHSSRSCSRFSSLYIFVIFDRFDSKDDGVVDDKVGLEVLYFCNARYHVCRVDGATACLLSML